MIAKPISIKGTALVKKVVFESSCGILEALLKHGIELGENGANAASWTFPSLFQRGKSQAELELQGVLGVEIATAVAAHNFQLAVDGFDDIGGGKRTTNGFRISEEGQVVGANRPCCFAKFLQLLQGEAREEAPCAPIPESASSAGSANSSSVEADLQTDPNSRSFLGLTK